MSVMIDNTSLDNNNSYIEAIGFTTDNKIIFAAKAAGIGKFVRFLVYKRF